MRLFVAAWPTREVLDALAGLDRPVHPLVRTVPPEQRHVTLRYLGEVPDDGVPLVLDALRATGARFPPLRAELGPATRRLGRNTLVVPVSGLEGLAGAVAEATRSLGESQPAQTFVGHVTIGRSRRGRSIPAKAADREVTASWLVEEMALVRSHLGQGGPRYETLATVRLALG